MKSPRRKKLAIPGFEAMTPMHRIVSNSMLKALEEATKLPTSEWHGKCYQMACAMVNHKIAVGDPVYGHWLGPIDPTGYWKERHGSPFVQHGWVLVPNGTIIDPTRWSFENVDPYIYIGPADHYDEGGNALRLSFERPCPTYVKPEDVTKDYQKTVSLDGLKEPALSFVLVMMGNPPGITSEMLFWLANLAPQRLGEHQDAIYSFLLDVELQAAIPMDNFRAWERNRKRA